MTEVSKSLREQTRVAETADLQFQIQELKGIR